jgi:NAD(P)-dependent dehydrogenase (short-subunit alcohol dehydrogenase family)
LEQAGFVCVCSSWTFRQDDLGCIGWTQPLGNGVRAHSGEPELTGKVAIVTGASAGIGRAYALALAGAGATVVAAARTLGDVDSDVAPSHTLTEVVEAARGLPGRIFAQVCDVESETDLVRMVDQAVANFSRIDLLVNNAAVMKRYDPFNVSCEEWDRAMRVNVRGPYLAIRQVAPTMMRQRSGSIVNVTALAAGYVPKGHGGHNGTLAYAISKAALNRLSFFMAEELKPYGVAVNALSPGVVRTATAVAARLPDGVGKPPTPEALGGPLLYLATQTASTLTGQILHSDEFGKSWP